MSQSRHKGSQAMGHWSSTSFSAMSPEVLSQMREVVSQVARPNKTVQSSTGSQVSVQVLSNSGTVSTVAPTLHGYEVRLQGQNYNFR